MKEKSLSDIINSQQGLTEQQVEALVDLIGYGCHQKTKDRLRSILTYSTSMIRNCGIYSRVMISKDKAKYVAGQSYPDEIREIKKFLLTGM